MIKAGAVFLFAPLSKERSSPKRTELYPLPWFYLLYSTTSFKISSVVVVVLMVEMHCPHNKKMAQKKAQQIANALTTVLEKLIFKFYCESHLSSSSHPYVWQLEWAYCYESYLNSNWVPNYKIME